LLSLTVESEVIFGANLISDFLSNITDKVGGRNMAYESRLAADRMGVVVLSWMGYQAWLTVDPYPEFFEDVGVITHSAKLGVLALAFAMVATAVGRTRVHPDGNTTIFHDI
jgi:hypothetical protein